MLLLLDIQLNLMMKPKLNVSKLKVIYIIFFYKYLVDGYIIKPAS